MSFAVATWNVQRGGRPGAPLHLAKLGVDAALLQEANVSRPWLASTTSPRTVIGRDRPWVSAVAAVTDLEPIETVRVDGHEFDLHQHHPGSVAAARFTPADEEPVVLVSLHAVFDGKWSYPAVLRLVSDLAPLLHKHRKDRLILGGDFNAGATKLDSWRRIYEPVWQTLREFGLTDLTAETRDRRPPAHRCPCVDAPGCGHLDSQKPKKATIDHSLQVDNLWATKKLLANGVQLDLGEAGTTPWQLSDHRPLIATFG